MARATVFWLSRVLKDPVNSCSDAGKNGKRVYLLQKYEKWLRNTRKQRFLHPSYQPHSRKYIWPARILHKSEPNNHRILPQKFLSLYKRSFNTTCIAPDPLSGLSLDAQAVKPFLISDFSDYVWMSLPKVLPSFPITAFIPSSYVKSFPYFS